MVHPVIYAMRGWIAFVAFIEFSNAIRCFIDEKHFLETSLFPSMDEKEKVTSTMARLMGRYCLLNSIILIHCAFGIYHRPMISLTICSLSLTIVLYASEAFFYYSMGINFYVIFPVLISLFTIICLAVAPVFLREDALQRRQRILEEQTAYNNDDDEEFDEMLSSNPEKNWMGSGSTSNAPGSSSRTIPKTHYYKKAM